MAILERLYAVREGVFPRLHAEVLDSIVRNDIVIECCPSSNVRIGRYEGYSSHPVGAFIRDAGIRCTINSDDPAIFGSEAWRELAAIKEAQSFTITEVAALVAESTRSTAAALDTGWLADDAYSVLALL